MLTVVVTNLSASEVSLDDMYANLGAAGSSTASLTFTASAAALDRMDALKALLNAGTVSVSVTRSSDDIDFLSAPIEQHGVSGNLAVDAVAVVTSAVTFPKAFAVAPKLTLTVVQGATTNFKANVYARSVTASGFTIALDVTTAGTASGVCTVHWTAVY